MSIIAADTPSLEGHPERFCPEALAAVLPEDLVADALADCGVKDGLRRKLPVRLTAWLVILLCLFRDRSYVDLIQMVTTASSWRGLWKDTGPPTSSALSKARDRVGVPPMQLIYEHSAARWIEETEGVLFHGLRLTAIDGTCGKVPDSLKNDAFFGRPGSSRGRSGYPQIRFVGLMDVGTRLQRAVRFGPYRTGEMTLARAILPQISAELLVLLDRNFLSYDFLSDILQRGSHFVVRVKKNTKVRVIRQHGPGDALVGIDVPRHWRKDRPDLPRTLTWREIRYTPESGKEEIRLFTDLLDVDEISREEIADCYHERWSVETGIEEIKTRLSNVTTITQPTLLRSKTPMRVQQEAWALFTVNNALRMTMVRAAESVPQSPAPARLSFTAALHQFRDGVRDMMLLPTWRLIRHYDQLLRAIASVVVPLRPGRVYPRAVKIKMSGYPRKRAPEKAA